MKRADIEVGKVYGHSERRDHISRYQPVLVLSTDLYMIPRYGDQRGQILRADGHHTSLTTGRRGLGNAVGLLCVMLRATDHDTVRKVRAYATPEAAGAIGRMGDTARKSARKEWFK